MGVCRTSHLPRAACACARIVTAGTLDRPEGPLTLENNTWVIGDDAECLVIDAGHDGRAIVKSIPREQRVQGVLVSHGHVDHIDAVGEVCDGTRAPAHLHPDDRFLWDELYPVTPDAALADGQVLTRRRRRAARHPHPGAHARLVLLPRPALGVVFTGDTLFPGRTRRDPPRLQRLRHHHRVGAHPAVHPARGHRGAARARRLDRDRRRGARTSRSGSTDAGDRRQ